MSLTKAAPILTIGTKQTHIFCFLTLENSLGPIDSFRKIHVRKTHLQKQIKYVITNAFSLTGLRDLLKMNMCLDGYSHSWAYTGRQSPHRMNPGEPLYVRQLQWLESLVQLSRLLGHCSDDAWVSFLKNNIQSACPMALKISLQVHSLRYPAKETCQYVVRLGFVSLWIVYATFFLIKFLAASVMGDSA